jgi:hypothetical protein
MWEPRRTDPTIQGNALGLEDAHVELLDSLAAGGRYDLLDLGDGSAGLVVDGELRAAYRPEVVYPRGSTTARIRLEAAEREAQLAANKVRGFQRAFRGSGAVPGSVEEEPAAKEEAEALGDDDELSDIERRIGVRLDATPAERAIRRDRRGPASDWLSEPKDEPERVVVEGLE